MSGAIKSVGKVFKKAAMAPIKLAKKVDKFAKSVVKKVWKIKLLRYIIIAVAAYFTAGAAMAYFGAAGAAGGVAAAGASAGTAAAAGTAATVGSTAAVAGGTAAFSGAAVGAAGVTALEGVTVTATVGAAAGASAVTAGAIAAASVGAAAGLATANAASDAAQGAMNNGNGTVTGAPGGMGTTANAGGTGQGMFGPVSGTDNFATGANAANGATDLAPINVTADVGADTSSFGFGVTDNVGPIMAANAVGNVGRVDTSKNPDGSPKSFYDKAKDLVKKPLGQQTGAEYDSNGALISPDDGLGSSLTSAGSGAGSSGMGAFGKTMLLKSAVDFAGAYLNKPPQQGFPLANQYGGYDKDGNGPGMALHSTNGGFGLGTGGPGQGPTSGVPGALQLNGSYGTTGAGGAAPGTAGALSNAALAGNRGAPGNIGQAVANSAGVGGLIPQGAVDYMHGGNS